MPQRPECTVPGRGPCVCMCVFSCCRKSNPRAREIVAFASWAFQPRSRSKSLETRDHRKPAYLQPRQGRGGRRAGFCTFNAQCTHVIHMLEEPRFVLPCANKMWPAHEYSRRLTERARSLNEPVSVVPPTWRIPPAAAMKRNPRSQYRGDKESPRVWMEGNGRLGRMLTVRFGAKVNRE